MKQSAGKEAFSQPGGSIPTIRQSIGSRQSLGPSRITRTGSSQNTAPPNESIGSSQYESKGRVSLYASSQEARQSMSGLGVRKSSFGGSGPSSSAPQKDPRPIRDKNFQLNCIKILIEFLAKSGYDKPISSKILTAPSSKDFQNIFRFLYGKIDPTYEFGKKFEEEVPLLIKSIRYPYANDISKSQLYACLCDDTMDASDTVDNSTTDQLFFAYLCRAYKAFLAGEDNFEDASADLKHSFDVKNDHILRAIKLLEGEAKELDDIYKAYMNEESPLQKVDRECKTYASDVGKFSKFISHLEGKREKMLEQLDRLNQDIAIGEHELGEIEVQRQQLQAQVDSQNICPEDIDKMNSEKEQLVKALNSLNQVKEDTSKVFWEREVAVQKKIDIMEKLVQEYNFAGERIGIIPRDASNASNMDFELSFNPHSVKGDNIVNLPLREHVQSYLASLRDQTVKVIHQHTEQTEGLKEEICRIREHIEDKRNEISVAEQRLSKLGQQYAHTKEAFGAENKKSSEEFELLQTEVSRIRSEMSSSYLSSQQALQKTTMSYDQTCSKIAEENEKLGREIFRILEELINFKTFVEVSLNEINSVYHKELQ